MNVVLTPEEFLASQKANFQELSSGKLFNLGMKRYFITIKKSGDFVEVIELNAENIRRIINEQPCVHSTLNFDEMEGLNLV